ncbi:MAG TPA: hypothetical protein VFG54_17165 [Prolixibacteraceae bacterium]|nr:hypothetical protein [Prolixibacteraceae bacterium]
MNTNDKYRFILLTLLIFAISIIQPVHLLGQSQIFLLEDEINGYKLKNHSKTQLYSSDKQLRTADVQQFKMLDSKGNQYIYIQYFVFNSIPSAIDGTNRLSQRFAVPYIWGSPTGNIIGEDTWTILNPKLINSNAIFFVRGNIGIQLFIQGTVTNQLVKLISDKIVKKIDKYLSTDVTSNTINSLSDSVINMQPNMQKSYINSASKLSQWVIDSIQYKSGLRKEWNNGAITMGIDICLLKDTQEALAAAKIKSKNCSISKNIYDLNDQNYKQFIESEWNYYMNSKISNQTFSFIAYKGPFAFHVYGLNIANSNFDITQAIINELANHE